MRFPVWLLAAMMMMAASASAQLATRDGTGPANTKNGPHRIHLILKDGSYQIVTSYKVVKGKIVQLRFSAERGGEHRSSFRWTSSILHATQKLGEASITVFQPEAPPVPRPAPALDPEFAQGGGRTRRCSHLPSSTDLHARAQEDAAARPRLLSGPRRSWYRS